MFILGVVLLCVAVLIFVTSMLLSANPKKGIKNIPGYGETVALLIVTGLFNGCISMFLAFQLQDVVLRDYLVGSVLAVATVFIVKYLKIPTRLAAHAANAAQSQIIHGAFGSNSPSDVPNDSYRKAA